MIPIPIRPDQVRTVTGLPWRSCPQPCRRFGKTLRLRTQSLLQQSPMFGLGRAAAPRGPLFQSLNETVIKSPDNKLAHIILMICYHTLIAYCLRLCNIDV